MRALLIIGLQIDFLPGSEALAARVNDLRGQFDLLLAARFFLPANHLSFAANHPWRQPGQSILIEGHPTLLQPMYGVQGSFGAEFVPGFSEADFDFIADLGTEKDSIPFCAFYDAGNGKDTGLKDFLESKKVNSLQVMGLPETVVANTEEVAAAMGF